VVAKKLEFFVKELFCFGIRQAQACLFAGSMLAMILLTSFFWPPDISLARYDFLFFFAVFIQVIFIACKLESKEEIRVICIFHIVGTIMEIFKTHMGSWSYPEENLLRIGGVPLFSGFMYSAIGSYIARIWRIFSFRFDHFPLHSIMALLCALIYINFFTHHYTIDIRYGLFVFTAGLFFRTRVYFTPHQHTYHMPLLLGFVLVALFIWVAENIGTLGAVWLYPTQRDAWHLVSLNKMGSWFLMIIISFVLVSLIHRKRH
jgi:uncharacterized membrane protein YoaT (DUF817 family)